MLVQKYSLFSLCPSWQFNFWNNKVALRVADFMAGPSKVDQTLNAAPKRKAKQFVLSSEQVT